jgi:ribonucleoside-diphosphate reductase alpha chain
VSKFAHVRFEPSGFTGNAEVPIAKSIVDYIFRWMGSRFLSKDDRDALGILGGAVVAEVPSFVSTGPASSFDLAAGIVDSTAAEPPPAPSTSSGGEGGDRPMRSASASAATAPAGGRARDGDGSHGGNGVALSSLGTGQRLAFSVSADSPSCMDCGSIMVRNGSCYKCLNCGATSGCS